MLKLRSRTSGDGHTVEPQGMSFEDTVSRLYDLGIDPRQQKPIGNAEIEHRLKRQLIAEMIALDAPQEAFRRFDLAVQT